MSSIFCETGFSLLVTFDLYYHYHLDLQKWLNPLPRPKIKTYPTGVFAEKLNLA